MRSNEPPDAALVDYATVSSSYQCSKSLDGESASSRNAIVPRATSQECDVSSSAATAHDGKRLADENELSKTRDALEALQLQNVDTLVRSVDLLVAGIQSKRKLLYLTNEQAQMNKFRFNDPSGKSVMKQDVMKFLDAFGVTPHPDLIINLFPSYAFFTWAPGSRAHHSKIDKDGMSGIFSRSMYDHAEVNDEQMFSTDQLLSKFLQESVHVFIHNDSCSLASASQALLTQSKDAFDVLSLFPF